MKRQNELGTLICEEQNDQNILPLNITTESWKKQSFNKFSDGFKQPK